MGKLHKAFRSSLWPRHLSRRPPANDTDVRESPPTRDEESPYDTPPSLADLEHLIADTRGHDTIPPPPDEPVDLNPSIVSPSLFPVAQSRSRTRSGFVDVAVALAIGAMVGGAAAWGSGAFSRPSAPACASTRNGAQSFVAPAAAHAASQPVQTPAPLVIAAAQAPAAPAATPTERPVIVGPAAIPDHAGSTAPPPVPAPTTADPIGDPADTLETETHHHHHRHHATESVERGSVSPEAVASAHVAPPVAPAAVPAVVPQAPVAVAPQAAAPPPERTRPQDPAECRARCNAQVDCLLRCFEPMRTNTHATTPIAIATPAAAPDGSRSAPSDADIQRALARVSGEVQSCAPGSTGRTTIQLTIAGSGRITTVNVGFPYAGTPMGSCLARAIRHARVDPFTQSLHQASIAYQIPQ